MPPTLRCPFRLTKPAAVLSLMNLAVNSSLGSTNGTFIRERCALFVTVPVYRLLLSIQSYKMAAFSSFTFWMASTPPFFSIHWNTSPAI